MAADVLNLRAAPSLDAEIVGQVSRASPVAVLDDAGPALPINGQPDHWTLVATFQCIDDPCEHFRTGWVVDSYLAFDDRFEPLNEWRAGTVAGYDLRSVFSYEVTADGAFTRRRSPCVAGACDPAPTAEPDCALEGEVARDGFCVLSGRLYRYRDLVRGQGMDGGWLDRQDVTLFVDGSGDLCAYGSQREGGAGMCDRTGAFAPGFPDPEAAVLAAAEYRRERLALTAADMLNLRAEPSVDGEIVGRLPRSTAVERLDELLRQSDVARLRLDTLTTAERWVRVRVTDCHRYDDGICEWGATGWVVDSFLAYEDRLEAITAWRVGTVSGYGGDYGFGYDIAADGTVVSWGTCDEYNNPDTCTETGRLFRYRDLILAKADDGHRLGSLYVDESGRLCLMDLRPDFEYDARCDR